MYPQHPLSKNGWFESYYVHEKLDNSDAKMDKVLEKV
jgi:hypothetical protein